MDNKINQIIHLKNGTKYLVINQAIYQGKSYYFVVGVTEDEQELTQEFQIVEETKKDGSAYLSTVKDPELIKLLAEYLEPKA